MPTFSGKREDWEPFRDLFRALIHDDHRLSDVERLYYLKTHVAGEAKAALAPLTITGANYTAAWSRLEDRFEHRRLLVHEHLSQLQHLKPLRDESSTGLQSLLDTLSRHREQLRALGRPVDAWDDWFISVAATCMDSATRRAWENEMEKMGAVDLYATRPEAESTRYSDPMATFAMLAEFLRRRCHTLSSVESGRSSRPSASRLSSTASASQSFRSLATRDSENSCARCKGHHYLGHCQDFLAITAAARRQFVNQSRLCFNCLRPGHMARSCPSRSVCQRCQALHHSLLHADDRKRETSSTEVAVPPKQPRRSQAEQGGLTPSSS